MNTPDKLLVVLREPRSLISESYRSLRTSIQRALGQGVQTIMFVSTFGGDGKSTVCSNVAATLTQLYLDVVMVDCDLRRPTLTRLFGAQDHIGLGDFLAGKAALDDLFFQTEVERLRIIPAGNVLENAGDLLGRPALGEFCTQLRTKCDVAIFDTSPLSACSDALSLGPHVDTSAMVINPKRWDGDVEVKIRQSLEAHGVPLMGIVLNGVDANERGSYSYGYGRSYRARYGYGYGEKRKAMQYGYGYDPEEEEAVGGAEQKKSSWLKRLANWWGQ